MDKIKLSEAEAVIMLHLMENIAWSKTVLNAIIMMESNQEKNQDDPVGFSNMLLSSYEEMQAKQMKTYIQVLKHIFYTPDQGDQPSGGSDSPPESGPSRPSLSGTTIEELWRRLSESKDGSGESR